MRARAGRASACVAVLVLRAVVLALDHDAGRQVRDAHRRFGLVDVLAAGAAGAERVDAQVGRVDLDVGDLLGLGHHGDRGGRGVDAALRLGRGHALHAVAAGLELELRVGALADDARDDFLEAAARRPGSRRAPRPASGCARRSACTCGSRSPAKSARLVAAGAGADLEEEVACSSFGSRGRSMRCSSVLERGRCALARALDLVLGEALISGSPRHLLGGGDVGLGLRRYSPKASTTGWISARSCESCAELLEVAVATSGREQRRRSPRGARRGWSSLAAMRGLHGGVVGRARRVGPGERRGAQADRGARRARFSASRSAARRRAAPALGACRSLLVRPCESASSTASGSSPRGELRARARARLPRALARLAQLADRGHALARFHPVQERADLRCR